MSRVVILAAPEADVLAYCAKAGIGLSVVEPLPSGQTRAVLNNVLDADKVRKGMKAMVVSGPVARSPLYVSRTQSPYR
ncbi:MULTISPECIES: hypothetical protein [unclassified Sphingobium]|uniref:hypothetical protein n=1 Tax=unclassified Sphingobium TaxID=2611147 RepID=UPI0022257CA2|nr:MULTISPECIES: hypothetical protein [unclassified Sphingobium]MCW2411688.1 hypothetical protein [Sphingobium sp. B8D3D]MCW2416018.1 hypothetical protein [Sphingobium sp. B8D3A]